MSIPFTNLKDSYKFPTYPLYPSNKPAYFYDGQLKGDMADFYAQSLEPRWGQEEEFDDVPF